MALRFILAFALVLQVAARTVLNFPPSLITRRGFLAWRPKARVTARVHCAERDVTRGRTMGSLEEVFTRFNRMGIYTLSSAVLLDKLPDVQRLQDALSYVQAGYDLLQCGIQPRDSGFAFVPIPAAAKLEVIDAAGLTLDDVLASEVSRKWGAHPDQLPYQVWLASGLQSEHPALGLSMSHALLDGLSAAKLLDGIVQRYNCEDGKMLVQHSQIPVPISPSVETLAQVVWSDIPLLRKLLVLARLVSKSVATGGFVLPRLISAAPGPSERRSRVLLRVLPAHLVDSVRSKAREQGTSVTGALCGALTLAIAREWCSDRDYGRPCKVVVQQAVDLSSRLMSASERSRQLGCFVDGFTTVQRVQNVEPSAFPDRLWEVARTSNDELRESIGTKGWIANSEETSLLLGLSEYASLETIFGAVANNSEKGRTASALLSNMGVVDVGNCAGPKGESISIVRFHLGEAQSRVGFGVMLHAATMAKSGEMCLTYSYAEPVLDKREIQRLADRVEEGLVEAVSDRGRNSGSYTN